MIPRVRFNARNSDRGYILAVAVAWALQPRPWSLYRPVPPTTVALPERRHRWWRR